MRRILTIFFALALLATTPLVATPFLDVHPTATPPRIDGVLDDAAWRDAAHTDAFRQIYPLENAAPTERTELWVTYDANFIYVAVRCHDPMGTAGVRAFSMQRDEDNGSDDFVRLAFDTFHRQSDGYFFSLTAAGGMIDGLIQNKDETNYQWDGIWYGKVSRDSEGWSAEFAIPMKTIAFDPANDTWGFNVARTVRRKNETERWSGFSRAKSVFFLPALGELRGLHGLRQGRGIDFKPYATLTHHSDAADTYVKLKPGFDLIWQMTPSLAGTVTVNTDFADADVDDRQVNLSRFSLFFPEKRAFFTQDASLFTFAGIQQDPLPFFSRRIGLADDGSTINLLGGAKLTGRAGPWTIGVLDVETDAHAGIPAENLFVGRISHQVLAESSVGVVATNGDPTGVGKNNLVGADFDYANSHLPGNRTITIRTGIQMTDSDRVGGKGTATTMAINFPNEPLGATAWFSAVDQKYDPALGFVSRTGVADFHENTWYNLYFDSKLVRLFEPFIETDNVTDLHGGLLDDGRWVGIYAENAAGDYLNIWSGHYRETYQQTFEIWPGIVLPVGRHLYDNQQIQLGTVRSRMVNAFLRWRHGGFVTGRTNDYEAQLGARVTGHLELGLNGLLRDIHLPQGNFQVKVTSASIVYSISPSFQVRLLGQYDNSSSALGVNFRIKWIVQPGNELFLVMNQGYDAEYDRVRPVANDVSLKTAWTVRF